MKKTATFTKEEIFWRDHTQYLHKVWYSPGEVDEMVPEHLTSIGWIIRERKDHLIMTLSVDEDGLAQTPFVILKENIIKRRKLK